MDRKTGQRRVPEPPQTAPAAQTEPAAQTGPAVQAEPAAQAGPAARTEAAASAAKRNPAAQTEDGEAGARSGEERSLREEFLKLANGKYKAAYAAEVQRIIDRRFRDARNSEAELKAARPVLDLLLQRYGIKNRDMECLLDAVTRDDPTLAERAGENGVSVEQQRHMDELERQVERLRRAERQRMQEERARQTTGRWLAEAAALRSGEYPGFDFREELQNPDFTRLLHAGLTVRQTYELLHRDELLRDAQRAAEARAEKRLLDDIRAQGMRPRENGAAAQSGFISRTDPRSLTREDRAKIRERVSRGERVVF